MSKAYIIPNTELFGLFTCSVSVAFNYTNNFVDTHSHKTFITKNKIGWERMAVNKKHNVGIYSIDLFDQTKTI